MDSLVSNWAYEDYNERRGHKEREEQSKGLNKVEDPNKEYQIKVSEQKIAERKIAQQKQIQLEQSNSRYRTLKENCERFEEQLEKLTSLYKQEWEKLQAACPHYVIYDVGGRDLITMACDNCGHVIESYPY